MSDFKPINLPKTLVGSDLDSIDPLDSRYYDEEIARHLSERSRIAYQAYVEAALAQTLADYGICTSVVANQIEKSARSVKAENVYEEEKTTRHDIKALVNCIKASLPDKAKPYVHFGATSYDIIATANALQMRSAITELVVPRMKELLKVLITLTERYANTTQIGRTHGQHAVPITFGFALSEYAERLGTSILILEDLAGTLVGKFSGAVGAYNALSLFVSSPLDFEESVLAKLNLKPAPFSSQITPPEVMVRVINEMVVAAGVMANLAHDMRHLQRSEIAEVRERFEEGQTGSSTMAHKRNPWNFENVVSMSKQITAQSVNANLNLSSEHQRDLTDSASSRFYVIVPASLASMTRRLMRVMQKVEVDELMMQKNLELTGGAIAAEPLYLLFEKYGHTTAHEKSKELAHLSLKNSTTLVEAINKDKEASKYWSKFNQAEKQIIEEPEKYYIGLAAIKARKIAKRWKNKI